MKSSTIALIAITAAMSVAQPSFARSSNYNPNAGGNGNGNGAANANCNSAHFFGSCDSGGSTTYAAPAPSVGNSLMGLILAGGIGTLIVRRRSQKQD